MAQVEFRDSIPDVGPIHFLRAEWRNPNARFVLIRYSVEGKEVPLGLRMDLDKRAILDDLWDPELDKAVKARASEIWTIVAQWRRNAKDDIFAARA